MSSLPVVLAQQGGPPASPRWPIAVFALGVAGLLWGLYWRAYQNSSTPTVPSDGHDGGSVYVLSNPDQDDLVNRLHDPGRGHSGTRVVGGDRRAGRL